MSMEAHLSDHQNSCLMLHCDAHCSLLAVIPYQPKIKSVSTSFIGVSLYPQEKNKLTIFFLYRPPKQNV